MGGEWRGGQDIDDSDMNECIWLVAGVVFNYDDEKR